MMTRRHALKTTALASAACAAMPSAIAQPQPAPVAPGPFTLPPLPYAFDALEPHIDARTMEIHHDKHHAAYVVNLNKAVADFPDLAKKSVEDLLKDLKGAPESVRTAVRNNGGGHFNHSLFWQIMKKNGGGEPRGELAQAIGASFGSFNDFRSKFNDAATKIFGSGWAWLVLLPPEGLAIGTSANQDSPLLGSMQISFMERLPAVGGTRGITSMMPLLGLDVWEHAYYLKYQNRRADYIAAWWNVVNWDFVAERYAKFKG